MPMNKRIDFVLPAFLIALLYASAAGCNQVVPGNKTEMVAMRDGAELATDLYFPENGKGPFP